MEITIKNHSNGTVAGVTSENQLQVEAEVHELQHHISRKKGQSYQVTGETDTLTAATIPVLHIRNDDPDRKLVISFIRMGIVDSNATMPTATDYFQMGFDATVTGGTATIPVNMNRNSGADALATATASTPTSAGTFLETDMWPPKEDGDRNSFNKQGSVILGLNDTFEIRFTSTSTTGKAWARITFMMMEFNGS